MYLISFLIYMFIKLNFSCLNNIITYFIAYILDYSRKLLNIFEKHCFINSILFLIEAIVNPYDKYS